MARSGSEFKKFVYLTAVAILIGAATQAGAASAIKGMVTDADGAPLAGASIQIVGTVTDDKGAY